MTATKREAQQTLRQLPSVDEAARAAEQRGVGPRWALLQALREQLDELRQRIIAGETARVDLDPARLELRVAELAAPSLRPVINATGVVLHTNLGRAPLSEPALAALARVARGYSNLELELEPGSRGSRHVHLARPLREVCGAEDAVVVNNNAAAVLLGLAALAGGREVIVSRGELVEIGGSFRLPDVMQASGARLREVGTTNRTHLRDYEGAIGEATGLLLKVHQSNFAIVGFTAEVAVDELVALARRRGVPAMFDLGSGTLVDLRRFGLPAELTVQQAVAAGFDLVTFSGDKLLGGPQAGVVCGRAEAVAKVRSHPLMRAVRPDKMTLAALAATLRGYRDGQPVAATPALAMLAASPEAIKERAETVAERLRPRLSPAGWRVEVVATTSRVGGGAAPTSAPASWAVALVHPEIGTETTARRLRLGQPAVVGRIEDDRPLLDLRTVLEAQVDDLVSVVGTLADRG